MRDELPGIRLACTTMGVEACPALYNGNVGAITIESIYRFQIETRLSAFFSSSSIDWLQCKSFSIEDTDHSSCLLARYEYRQSSNSWSTRGHLVDEDDGISNMYLKLTR